MAAAAASAQQKVVLGEFVAKFSHQKTLKKILVMLDAIKAEIGKAYGTLMTGYQKGDWKVTSQIYGPNCVIMSPGKSNIKGREGQ